MATPKDNVDPNTSVPHDETSKTEVGGRKADPKGAPQEQPDPSTTVPHDET